MKIFGQLLIMFVHYPEENNIDKLILKQQGKEFSLLFFAYAT